MLYTYISIVINDSYQYLSGIDIFVRIMFIQYFYNVYLCHPVKIT